MRATPATGANLPLPKMEDLRIEQIQVDGRRLSWRTVGAGPSLLLANGYGATGADWDPTFLAALGEGYTVICPDNRGIGASDLGEEPLTVEAMAADLEVLLDAAEIAECAVAGWSMGGFVAQRLAEARPDRVKRLALIATDPGGPNAVPADPRTWELLLDHSGTPREQASRLISLLFPPAEAVEIDRQFGEIVAAARAALSPVALRAQEGAMEGWHRDDRPPLENPPPTLVLHGEEDRVIPATNAPLLSARWQTESVEVLSGCGHAVMAQRPEPIASRLGEFLGAA